MRAFLPVLATALLFSAACDSNDDPIAPQGAVTIASTTTAANVPAGGSISLPVTITRSGDFTGPVTLSASALPTGVTASFSPANLTGSETTSALTLTAASTVAIGSSTINLTATGEGVDANTVSIPLTIDAAVISLTRVEAPRASRSALLSRSASPN